jgi:putative FmdB family regulatory protein
MPLYTYRCPKCEERDSHLVRKFDSHIEIKCPTCNVIKEKIFDASGQVLDFKGEGWFKTSGKY